MKTLENTFTPGARHCMIVSSSQYHERPCLPSSLFKLICSQATRYPACRWYPCSLPWSNWLILIYQRKPCHNQSILKVTVEPPNAGQIMVWNVDNKTTSIIVSQPPQQRCVAIQPANHQIRDQSYESLALQCLPVFLRYTPKLRQLSWQQGSYMSMNKSILMMINLADKKKIWEALQNPPTLSSMCTITLEQN